LVDGLQVRLFGDVSIERDGLSVLFPPGKALELFCYLLVHRDRAHTREFISEMLWPDVEPTVSKKYLRQALWRLNTAMQHQSSPQGTGKELVVVDPNWIRINPDAPWWLDVNAFEQSYVVARDTPGRSLSDRQAHGVESALELYRGDLIATWYHDWCSYERDRLQLAYLAMLDQLMGYCEARGFYAKGVGFGQAVLRYDAARESTHCQLMRLHCAAGNRAAALRQYERCASILAKEFGIGPSADTTALYQQIHADRVNDIPVGTRQPVAAVRPAREAIGLQDLRVQLDQIQAGVFTLQESFLRNNGVLFESPRARWSGSSRTAGWAAGGTWYRRRRPTERIRDEVRVMGGASYANSMQHVLAELARLDVLLGSQVRRVRRSSGTPDDGLSGFYIPEAEIDALLDAPIGDPVRDTDPDHSETGLQLDRLSTEIAEHVAQSVRQGVYLRLVALVEVFDLGPFDVEVVVMCLAPEVDRRYGRLYAYLHDDVTRRAPTVDLVLSLLCADLGAKMTARTRFGPSAPLVRHGLVTLAEDPAQPSYSLLDKNILLAGRVARFLLDDDGVAEQLGSYVRLVVPAVTFGDLHFPAEFGASLARLAEHADDDLVVYCQGSYGVGKQSVAAACCRRWNVPLLVVSADLLASRPAEEFAMLLRLVDREARLQGAVMYWENVDVLLGEEMRARLALLLSTLAVSPGPAFLAGDTRWEPADAPHGMTFVRLEFPAPGYAERVRLWSAAFDRTEGAALDLAAVSGKFRLTGGQIRDTVATARNLAHLRAPGDPQVTQDDLQSACRLQSNRRLAALAEHITPHSTWHDIVLPAEKMEQLREVANQVRYRAQVYEAWGFERKVAGGRGLAVLFAGPSGTGKTMAADVLAHDLGLDLYKIDLSTVVSKYIGETEKNLARIFAEAASSNAILFFDEADALFGKRSQVRDAHDRYANLEISYLLQKMEDHEGVVILATNLRKNLDDAFVRRLHAVIEFPVPGVEERRRIWEQVWPEATPRDQGLDLDLLAQQIDLPGGNIRNIALAGAFLAAADGGVVTMAHVVRATRREYRKMGKILTTGEFGAPITSEQDARHALPSA
jgi:DNA-binding SARP family transcriptional activator/ATP-dependent 26S proteasome regulatory subunit